jgi:nicotinamide-nucleotide amidase
MAEHADIVITTLATELGSALKAHGFMLALAESCTGGLVAQSITNIPGSSTWFDRGFITYSNIAKTEMLCVSNDCLNQHGAVSEQTALEMAHGALTNSHAHVAASITGIAGPGGGSAEIPVGTVWFSIHGPEFEWVEKQVFSGNRQEVQAQSVNFALQQLHRALELQSNESKTF